MNEIIAGIIRSIPIGVAFDSHYVIATLIQKHSDDYLRFVAAGITSEAKLTESIHSQLARIIKTFNGTLVEQQPFKSYSYTIRGKANQCTLWLRRE